MASRCHEGVHGKQDGSTGCFEIIALWQNSLPLSLTQVLHRLSSVGISQFVEDLVFPRPEPYSLCAMCQTVTTVPRDGTTTSLIL